MNKIILIPDSFKGTMTSAEICKIMATKITERYKDCEVISIPVADGGEGSVDAFLAALGGRKIYKTVTGPWNEKVEGYWGLLPNGTAVIEMAAAAALPMVGDRKDPSLTTTYGVGELLIDALDHNAKKIIIGLGGSATNDAATGLLSALGIAFYDKDNKPFIPTGATLNNIENIQLSSLDSRLHNLPIITMCDIDNPFYGPEGAAKIYGPQKGADEKMIEMLDCNMKHFADIIERTTGINVQLIPGSGAAGGMGGGLAALLGASLQMGIETVLDTVDFNTLLEGADFVFTGEGRIDGQSLRGKVVIGVATRAKKHNVKVIAFVGDIGNDIERAYTLGVTGIFSINRLAIPYREARQRAKEDMALTVDNVLRYTEAIY